MDSCMNEVSGRDRKRLSKQDKIYSGYLSSPYSSTHPILVLFAWHPDIFITSKDSVRVRLSIYVVWSLLIVGWAGKSNRRIVRAEMDFAVFPNIWNLGVNAAIDSARYFKLLQFMMESLWQSYCCLFSTDRHTWCNQDMSQHLESPKTLPASPVVPTSLWSNEIYRSGSWFRGRWPWWGRIWNPWILNWNAEPGHKDYP